MLLAAHGPAQLAPPPAPHDPFFIFFDANNTELRPEAGHIVRNMAAAVWHTIPMDMTVTRHADRCATIDF